LDLELELVLERDSTVPIVAERNAQQDAHCLHGNVDTLCARGDVHIAPPLQAHCEQAIRMGRVDALVDVRDRLTPAVQELDDVIAAFDLRHRNEQEAILVNRDPGFGIGDVEVRIGPVHLAGLPVQELVPDEPLLVEIDLLLPCDQQSAEQVDVGVADILVGEL